MSTITKALGVLRREGLYSLIARSARRLLPMATTGPLMVRYEDALVVDWRTPHPSLTEPRELGEGPYTVAWIMSPPGANSGGHQNIFRFIKFLEDAGHRVRVYLSSRIDSTTPRDVRTLLARSTSYPLVAASIEEFPEGGLPADTDAVFATSWETAYVSFRDPSRARRFYFIQDFEPLFYETGSQAVLAENTYRFGFLGITAGGWLAKRVHEDYGMTATRFDFGAEPRDYSLTKRGARRGIFFYARPETARRGFELGAMALDLFARDRPGYDIILAGQSLSRLRLPFPHRVLGNLEVRELNEIYNQCIAGVVMSLTNMSLLPLELLAAGVIPVVNDGPNNRLVSDNPYISFAAPSPRAIADALIEIVDRQDAEDYGARGSASVAGQGWAAAGRQFLAAFEAGIHG